MKINVDKINNEIKYKILTTTLNPNIEELCNELPASIDVPFGWMPMVAAGIRSIFAQGVNQNVSLGANQMTL